MQVRRPFLLDALGFFGLGLLVFTAALQRPRFVFEPVDALLRLGAPLAIAGRIFLSLLLSTIVLAIPTALLFGLLTAAGRLSLYDEPTDEPAPGRSLRTLYRPVLALAALLTIVNGTLMAYLVPWGNASLGRLRLEIRSRALVENVEPGAFSDLLTGRVLFVRGTSQEDALWQGVFLAEECLGGESSVLIAKLGEVKVAHNGRRVLINLTNAISHEIDRNHPNRYQTSRYDRLEVAAWAQSDLAVRDLSLPALLNRLVATDSSTRLKRLLWVEIHKKLAIPALCLVFGFIALPIGLKLPKNRVAILGLALVISFFVARLYYLLLNQGERSVLVGSISPELAMWLPNLVLTGVGLILLIPRVRRKGVLLAASTLFLALLVGVLAMANAYPQHNVNPAAIGGEASVSEPDPTWQRPRLEKRQHCQWRQSIEGNSLYSWRRLESERRLYQLQIFRFHDDFSLRRRLAAEVAHFEESLNNGEGGWVISNGWVRTFAPSGAQEHYREVAGLEQVDLPEPPAFFSRFEG